MNPKLREFFLKHRAPARVGFVGESNWIGKAIREAQRPLCVTGQASRWSHVFLIGEDQTLLESDIKTGAHSGAQENPIEKWCVDDIDQAAVFDFGLTIAQSKLVLAAARKLVADQMSYDVAGLVSTWMAIVTQRTWKENPAHTANSMYCSAFVRYCYRKAKRDFCGKNLALSHTAPEHLSQAKPLHAYYWND